MSFLPLTGHLTRNDSGQLTIKKTKNYKRSRKIMNSPKNNIPNTHSTPYSKSTLILLQRRIFNRILKVIKVGTIYVTDECIKM